MAKQPQFRPAGDRSTPTRRAVVGATALTLVATLGLTACGNSGTEASAGTRTTSMYAWISTENDRAQWDAFITSAKTRDPNFTLTYEGPAFNDYWTKAKTRLSASDAPCIVVTQAARAQELKGVLAPLDDLAAANKLDVSQYAESMISGMTVDGTLRALPYDAEPMFLYYNKDLYKAAGLAAPTTKYTIDQYVSDVKKLTTGDVHGAAISPIVIQAFSFAFADGATPVTDGKLNLTDPAMVKGLQAYADLVTVAKAGKAPAASEGIDVQEQQFTSGKVATLIDGPWMYEGLKSSAKFDLGVAVIPSTSGEARGLIQGSGFGIANNCPDKDAAFKVIMQLVSPETIGDVAAARGTVPSIASAMPKWSSTKTPEADAVAKALLANGQPLLTTTSWNQVATIFPQYAPDLFSGKSTAAEVLETIQQQAGA